MTDLAKPFSSGIAPASARRMPRFAVFAWSVLGYNLLVILWGAYVRASGSGAGCGAHWPLCNGVVIPQNAQVQTMIEFTHRVMSGLALPLIAVLLVWGWRSYPRRHPVRLGSALAGTFIVTEALLGAGLVLFQLVAQNDSVARAASVAAHLANTFLLLAALALTAWWSSGGGEISLRRQGGSAWRLGLGLIGMLILGAAGAVTALGDTLFPSGSLVEGLQQDVSPTAHFLIRLRVIHPFIAIIMGVYLAATVLQIVLSRRDFILGRLAVILAGVFLLQTGLGVLNVVLLAPVWMQLVHLLVADLVWISLVLFSAQALSVPRPTVT
jgi:heme A synthase